MIWYDLRELLPKVYRKILDLSAAADSENEELCGVVYAANAIRDNFFIQTCDLKTIEYYEDLLGLQPFDLSDIELRRDAILTQIYSNQPFTMIFLKEQLNRVFGEGTWTASCLNGELTLVFNNPPWERVLPFTLYVYQNRPAHLFMITTVEASVTPNLNVLLGVRAHAHALSNIEFYT